MFDEFFTGVSKAQVFQRPPEAFDALSAPAGELIKHGLWIRPADAAPDAFRSFWARMFSRPISYLAPEFPVLADKEPQEFLRELPLGAERRRKPILRRSARRLESSRNWSGAYVKPAQSARMVQVMGRWTVPNVSRPALRPFDAVPGDEYHSSIWIGLDGRRGYPNESLPQIGTSQILGGSHGPGPQFGAWYQWWVRDRPAHHRPIEFMNFPVAPGDEILASLTVRDDIVLFHLKNQTAGVMTWFQRRVPDGVAPLGSTAEWIVERPTKIDDTRMYAMPDYGEVVFQDCLAVSQDTGNPVAATHHDLSDAGLIGMYEVFENPSRIAYVSTPDRVDGASVRVRFRD